MCLSLQDSLHLFDNNKLVKQTIFWTKSGCQDESYLKNGFIELCSKSTISEIKLKWKKKKKATKLVAK